MPSDHQQQLDAVRNEMKDLRQMKANFNISARSRSPPSKLRRSKIWGFDKWFDKWFDKLCCMKKKNVKSQVVTQPANYSGHGSLESERSRSRSPVRGRRVSWSGQGAPQSFDHRPIIRSRPAFDHPLDPPSTIFDASLDYYAMLELSPSASDSEIKRAYHNVSALVDVVSM